jgi:hypothetical protein
MGKFIYLLRRTDEWIYDEYDSVVVIAGSEEDAMEVGPYGGNWADNKYLEVTKVGVVTADVDDEWSDGSLVLASFNAG